MRSLTSLVLLLVTIAAGAAPRVEQFAPTGSVKDVRQATATFSEPMVPLGAAHAESPFVVDCDAPGSGRWLDVRRWVYDFDADVPGGARCSFTTVAGFESVAGGALEAATFSFDTGGPSIARALPDAGDTGIDESTVFLIVPDAPVALDSVRAHASCEIAGIGESIPVDLLDGDERRAVLDAQRRRGYPYARLLSAGESVEPLTPEAVADAEASVVALRCRRQLPPDSEVRLVWGAGIATPSGRTTTEDQTLTYRTRPAFTARFECPRVNARAGCLPGSDMKVVFTAPVQRKSLEAIALVADDDRRTPTLEAGDALEWIAFPGPFEPKRRYRVVLPDSMVDDAGRPLANASLFPLDVSTDDYPPLAKFAAEFGILEAREGGILPVTLRNLDAEVTARRLPGDAAVPGRKVRIDDDGEILQWLERVRRAMAPRGEWETGEDGTVRWAERTGSEPVLNELGDAQAFVLPREAGVDAAEFQVVGIPLSDPGFYVVELASPRLGAALLGEGAGPRYVATTALVTNAAVHLQWGRERSLVWVTALDSGAPVAGADVRISDYCSGNLLWRGVTNDDGVAHVGRNDGASPLPAPHEHAGCESWHDAPLFVSARTGGDLGFTISSWTDGISPSAFGLPEGRWQDPEIVHTVLDRTLLRAGETVSMKHVLRRRTSDGFVVPEGYGEATLVLRHDGSGETIESTLAFDGAGIAESTWAIPADAKLGRYQIELRFARGDDEQTFWPGDFRVEQYRVPTMRAVLQPPAAPLIAAREVPLDVFLEYLSGGGASGASVALRTMIEPRAVVHEQHEGFSFGGDDVEPGTSTDDRTAWYFPDAAATPASAPARLMPVVLDGAGSARVVIDDLPASARAHTLAVELEYADANGEISTVSRRIPLHPSAVELGIRTEGWVASPDTLRFQVLAVDVDGTVRADEDVEVELYSRKVYSYRKRLVGGYYAYENRTEVSPLDVDCAGETDTRGLLFCEVEPGTSGEVILRATATDDAGRMTVTTRSMWLAGDDDWWFAPGDGDRMDVLPEQDAYEPGNVARLQVRMPFREATALVTVAREGVMSSFVTTLSGSEPVVEVPVEAAFSPNVYVSVLAVRGRVGSVQTWLADLVRDWDLPWRLDGGSPTALVDLSKPAYRLGIARFDVGFAPHRLDVTVSPSAPTYEVRDTARVSVAVTRADGGTLPRDAEIAFAAVDEGLLELAANDSWQLLDAMMDRRGIELLTSTAQMQVVGKRHYGRKAVPAGGGGGHEAARELFDTLLLWHARVPLDATGRVELDVPLVDALTGYRLVAVATGGAGFFGTGSTSIRTTQDLIVHPGLPTVVREGDAFAATFTVRNASQRPLDVVAEARLAVDGVESTLAPQKLSLEAGAARAIAWRTRVDAGASMLAWDVGATSADGADDRVRVVQRVAAVTPVRVVQATLEQVAPSFEAPIERPRDALPGRGGIDVRLAPRLAGALDAVRDYMAGYPYGCFEQRASRALALRDGARWQALMTTLGAHLDRDGLVRYFPVEWLDGDDTLTSYLLTIAHEAEWEIPDGERERMLSGLTSFVEGRLPRGSDLAAADLSLRKLAAIAALARFGRAEPRMLGSLAIEPKFWPTSALVDWRDVLERLEGIDDRDALRRAADALLRAKLHATGTGIGLAEDDSPWWLLASGDTVSARLLAAALDWPAWQADAPRLARGVLGRLDEGHWDTTPANAWGVLAFEKFGARFEAVVPDGTTSVGLSGRTERSDWTTNSDGTTFTFDWPSTPGALTVSHAGAGRPWAFVTARAAIPLGAARFAGYRVERSVQPVEQKTPGRFTRGDVLEVRLVVDSPAEATWVVVDDPVPTGATILGSGLGRDSARIAVADGGRGAAWPAYVERRADAYRVYYRWVGKGTFEAVYRIRLDNPGTFALPPTRVEAMYAPERFAELPNESIEVTDG